MLERIITITQLLDREVRRQAAKDRTDLYTTTQSLRPWQKKFRNSYRFEEDFFFSNSLQVLIRKAKMLSKCWRLYRPLKGQYSVKKIPLPSIVSNWRNCFSYLENCSISGRKCQVADPLFYFVFLFFSILFVTFFFICGLLLGDLGDH